jgi:hypothetical protein
MGMAIATSITIAVLLAAIGLALGASVGIAALAALGGTLIGAVSILLGSRFGEAA